MSDCTVWGPGSRWYRFLSFREREDGFWELPGDGIRNGEEAGEDEGFVQLGISFSASTDILPAWSEPDGFVHLLLLSDR